MTVLELAQRLIEYGRAYGDVNIILELARDGVSTLTDDTILIQYKNNITDSTPDAKNQCILTNLPF